MEWLPFSHAIKWEDILLVVKRKVGPTLPLPLTLTLTLTLTLILTLTLTPNPNPHPNPSPNPNQAFDANASGSVMDAIWTLTEEQRAARRAPALSPLRGAPPARSPALAAVGGSRAACVCRAEP